jgi:hypothetical protein
MSCPNPNNKKRLNLWVSLFFIGSFLDLADKLHQVDIFRKG